MTLTDARLPSGSSREHAVDRSGTGPGTRSQTYAPSRKLADPIRLLENSDGYELLYRPIGRAFGQGLLGGILAKTGSDTAPTIEFVVIIEQGLAAEPARRVAFWALAQSVDFQQNRRRRWEDLGLGRWQRLYRRLMPTTGGR